MLKTSLNYFSSTQSFFTSDKYELSLHKLAIPPNHQFSPKRLTDFSTGRYCAIKALEQLGIKDAIIPIGKDREPIWPDGVVGSISHCDTLVGAIVAKKSKHISLGLDIEEIGRVTPDLFDLVFTEKEKSYLSSFKGRKLEEQSTLIFSMKEAFYKMQFPLTKTFLDFKDVEIEINNACFYLKILTEFPSKNKLPILNEIFYLLDKNIVITYAFYSITSK